MRVEGDQVELSADELIITETPREGWSVVTEQGVTVALDNAITPQLREAGVAREIVRLVQEARKHAGLEVVDRIELCWHTADEATRRAWTAHQQLISEALLAAVVHEGEPSLSAEFYTAHNEELDVRVWLRRFAQGS